MVDTSPILDAVTEFFREAADTLREPDATAAGSADPRRMAELPLPPPPDGMDPVLYVASQYEQGLSGVERGRSSDERLAELEEAFAGLVRLLKESGRQITALGDEGDQEGNTPLLDAFEQAMTRPEGDSGSEDELIEAERLRYAKVTGKTADGMSGDIPWVYDCETLRDGVALTAYNTVEDRLPAGPDYSTAFVPVDTPVLLVWNVSAERWEFSEIPSFEAC